MVTNQKELIFGQNNTKEQPACELIDEETNTAVDISGCTEIVYSIFSKDYETLLCTGTKTGDGEVTFVTDGTDGQAKFTPASGDMATPGRYISSWKFTFPGPLVAEVQGADVLIRPPAPT